MASIYRPAARAPASGDEPNPAVLEWLLSGDASVRYRTRRDLLGEDERALAPLRARIAREGWGRRFLDARDTSSRMWGGGLYMPKWVSTHYTLTDLMSLGLPGDHPAFRDSAELLLERFLGPDGGIYVAKTVRVADVCVTAMVLSLALYAGIRDERARRMLAYLKAHRQGDGGWNCDDVRSTTSCFNTTLSVLEALDDARRAGLAPEADLDRLSRGGEEWLLARRLYFGLRSGRIANHEFPYLSFPCRWKYDVLRALSYFARAGRPYDARMEAALTLLRAKRRRDGRWPVQRKHPGAVHFDMEKTGGPSRWNTLRALVVLRAFGGYESGDSPSDGAAE